MIHQLPLILILNPLHVCILIKVLHPGGAAVLWRWPAVYRHCLPPWVRGDMRMGGSTFVDIVHLTVAVEQHNTY